MNKKTSLTTTAQLRLSRSDLHDTWVLVWPKTPNDGAFLALSHDEIMRFPDLQDFLKDRVDEFDVDVTLDMKLIAK